MASANNPKGSSLHSFLQSEWEAAQNSLTSIRGNLAKETDKRPEYNNPGKHSIAQIATHISGDVDNKIVALIGKIPANIRPEDLKPYCVELDEVVENARRELSKYHWGKLSQYKGSLAAALGTFRVRLQDWLAANAQPDDANASQPNEVSAEEEKPASEKVETASSFGTQLREYGFINSNGKALASVLTSIAVSRFEDFICSVPSVPGYGVKIHADKIHNLMRIKDALSPAMARIASKVTATMTRQEFCSIVEQELANLCSAELADAEGLAALFKSVVSDPIASQLRGYSTDEAMILALMEIPAMGTESVSLSTVQTVLLNGKLDVEEYPLQNYEVSFIQSRVPSKSRIKGALLHDTARLTVIAEELNERFHAGWPLRNAAYISKVLSNGYKLPAPVKSEIETEAKAQPEKEIEVTESAAIDTAENDADPEMTDEGVQTIDPALIEKARSKISAAHEGVKGRRRKNIRKFLEQFLGVSSSLANQVIDAVVKESQDALSAKVTPSTEVLSKTASLETSSYELFSEARLVLERTVRQGMRLKGDNLFPAMSAESKKRKEHGLPAVGIDDIEQLAVEIASAFETEQAKKAAEQSAPVLPEADVLDSVSEEVMQKLEEYGVTEKIILKAAAEFEVLEEIIAECQTLNPGSEKIGGEVCANMRRRFKDAIPGEPVLRSLIFRWTQKGAMSLEEYVLARTASMLPSQLQITGAKEEKRMRKEYNELVLWLQYAKNLCESPGGWIVSCIRNHAYNDAKRHIPRDSFVLINRIIDMALHLPGLPSWEWYVFHRRPNTANVRAASLHIPVVTSHLPVHKPQPAPPVSDPVDSETALPANDHIPEEETHEEEAATSNEQVVDESSAIEEVTPEAVSTEEPVVSEEAAASIIGALDGDTHLQLRPIDIQWRVTQREKLLKMQANILKCAQIIHDVSTNLANLPTLNDLIEQFNDAAQDVQQNRGKALRAMFVENARTDFSQLQEMQQNAIAINAARASLETYLKHADAVAKAEGDFIGYEKSMIDAHGMLETISQYVRSILPEVTGGLSAKDLFMLDEEISFDTVNFHLLEISDIRSQLLEVQRELEHATPLLKEREQFANMFANLSKTSQKIQLKVMELFSGGAVNMHATSDGGVTMHPEPEVDTDDNEQEEKREGAQDPFEGLTTREQRLVRSVSQFLLVHSENPRKNSGNQKSGVQISVLVRALRNLRSSCLTSDNDEAVASLLLQRLTEQGLQDRQLSAFLAGNTDVRGTVNCPDELLANEEKIFALYLNQFGRPSACITEAGKKYVTEHLKSLSAADKKRFLRIRG